MKSHHGTDDNAPIMHIADELLALILTHTQNPLKYAHVCKKFYAVTLLRTTLQIYLKKPYRHLPFMAKNNAILAKEIITSHEYSQRLLFSDFIQITQSYFPSILSRLAHSDTLLERVSSHALKLLGQQNLDIAQKIVDTPKFYQKLAFVQQFSLQMAHSYYDQAVKKILEERVRNHEDSKTTVELMRIFCTKSDDHLQYVLNHELLNAYLNSIYCHPILDFIRERYPEYSDTLSSHIKPCPSTPKSFPLVPGYTHSQSIELNRTFAMVMAQILELEMDMDEKEELFDHMDDVFSDPSVFFSLNCENASALFWSSVLFPHLLAQMLQDDPNFSIQPLLNYILELNPQGIDLMATLDQFKRDLNADHQTIIQEKHALLEITRYIKQQGSHQTPAPKPLTPSFSLKAQQNTTTPLFSSDSDSKWGDFGYFEYSAKSDPPTI